MKIVNINRARQLNDFDNIMNGTLQPMDIDGFVEYNDLAYVFLEVKYLDKDLPARQRLAYERIVKDTSNTPDKKLSIAIVVEHSVSEWQEHVPISECNVRELYFSLDKKWRAPNFKCTFNELATHFIETVVRRNNEILIRDF